MLIYGAGQEIVYRHLRTGVKAVVVDKSAYR